jgi:tRNA uridine 5-carbamoylmethylation protein Kti12
MLGDYWVPNREIMVTVLYRRFLEAAMELGYNIVIDNMNLNSKTCRDIEASVKHFNSDPIYSTYPKYEVEYKDFFTPLEECIRRDSLRPNPIGEKVIRSTYNRYKNILENESSN